MGVQVPSEPQLFHTPASTPLPAGLGPGAEPRLPQETIRNLPDSPWILSGTSSGLSPRPGQVLGSCFLPSLWRSLPSLKDKASPLRLTSLCGKYVMEKGISSNRPAAALCPLANLGGGDTRGLCPSQCHLPRTAHLGARLGRPSSTRTVMALPKLTFKNSPAWGEFV